ncbi:ABC transporter ATP-binding protein [Methylobacterium sp. DCY52]|uniref:ABC transporter ATP-binding protein n=1 Tax=Methylobacterium sp. DCY52 TaxID=739139 RepID=UPI0031456F8F
MPIELEPSRRCDAPPILAVEGLSIWIRDGGRDIRTVHALEFSLAAGETLAIVGESGCGKSLTAFSLIGLLPQGIRAEGRVGLEGRNVLRLRGEALRRLRGGRAAMIFQESMTALNPVLRIGAQIVETLRAHERVTRSEARARALALLAQVRIPDPERVFAGYPHQLSGGMRQRVVIAMALACSPALLIADEPTTALDATVQAEILGLIDDLRRETGLAVLLISHDLELVRRYANRILVMYAGHAVESRSVEALFAAPLHPYTRGLVAARPSGGSGPRRLAEIPGQVPAPGGLGPGCSFGPRCPHATGLCHDLPPVPDPVDRTGKAAGRVACHHWKTLHVQQPEPARSVP